MTSACGIAEIVKTFRIKGMHVVEMNAVKEEFRINIFEIEFSLRLTKVQHHYGLTNAFQRIFSDTRLLEG